MHRFVSRTFLFLAPLLVSADTIAIKAGRLIDPETGTAAPNQVILVEAGRIKSITADAAAAKGFEVIDLSGYSVLPGLVDAHNHLALTYKMEPEHLQFYLTYVLDSTAIRAIQAVANGSPCCRRGSPWCATWETPVCTRTRQCASQSSRAGCRGRQ